MVKAALRVGMPLVAVRTTDPASAITEVCEAVNGRQDPPPLLVWDFIGGFQDRNDAGKSAVAKILGKNSPGLGPGDALAVAQRIAADAVLFSSRSYSEIIYREELDQISANDSSLRVIHTLTEGNLIIG